MLKLLEGSIEHSSSFNPLVYYLKIQSLMKYHPLC